MGVTISCSFYVENGEVCSRGKGTLQYADRIYKGEIVDAREHGKGKMQWMGGSTVIAEYDGQWHHGAMHGKGTFVRTNKYTYSGEFLQNRYHGKGSLAFEDSVITGEFRNGKAHGKGKQTFSDGLVVEGTYVDGKFEGKTKLTFADGTVEEWFWKDGKPVD